MVSTSAQVEKGTTLICLNTIIRFMTGMTSNTIMTLVKIYSCRKIRSETQSRSIPCNRISVLSLFLSKLLVKRRHCGSLILKALLCWFGYFTLLRVFYNKFLLSPYFAHRVRYLRVLHDETATQTRGKGG